MGLKPYRPAYEKVGIISPTKCHGTTGTFWTGPVEADDADMGLGFHREKPHRRSVTVSRGLAGMSQEGSFVIQ